MPDPTMPIDVGALSAMLPSVLFGSSASLP
jgi:hypothetical protein